MDGIRAGKAFVEFILSDKKFNSQLSKVAGKLRKFGAIGSAATAPLIAGFAAAVKTFASVGDELNKLSDRTGLSVKNLSELKHAAEQSDVSMSDLEMAFRNLQKKGFDLADFDQVAADIAAIRDPTKRTQAAIEAFGARTGTALLPMLRDLPMLRQEARKLGLTLNDETADAATNLGDQFGNAKAQLTALAVQIGAAVAGPLTEFFTWCQATIAVVIDFVRENQTLVAVVAAVTLGIAAVSVALVTLGSVLALYSAAVAGATAITTTFGIVLAIISAHPIIAALTVIAALVLAVGAYFGLASDSASEFKSSLDQIKTPAAPKADFAARGQQVQSELRSTISAPSASVVPRSAEAPVIRDNSNEVAHWTRETAEGVARLVAIAKKSGLQGGAF